MIQRPHFSQNLRLVILRYRKDNEYFDNLHKPQDYWQRSKPKIKKNVESQFSTENQLSVQTHKLQLGSSRQFIMRSHEVKNQSQQRRKRKKVDMGITQRAKLLCKTIQKNFVELNKRQLNNYYQNYLKNPLYLKQKSNQLVRQIKSVIQNYQLDHHTLQKDFLKAHSGQKRTARNFRKPGIGTKVLPVQISKPPNNEDRLAQHQEKGKAKLKLKRQFLKLHNVQIGESEFQFQLRKRQLQEKFVYEFWHDCLKGNFDSKTSIHFIAFVKIIVKRSRVFYACNRLILNSMQRVVLIKDVKEEILESYFKFCRYILDKFNDFINLGFQRKVVLREELINEDEKKKMSISPDRVIKEIGNFKGKNQLENKPIRKNKFSNKFFNLKHFDNFNKTFSIKISLKELIAAQVKKLRESQSQQITLVGFRLSRQTNKSQQKQKKKSSMKNLMGQIEKKEGQNQINYIKRLVNFKRKLLKTKYFTNQYIYQSAQDQFSYQKQQRDHRAKINQPQKNISSQQIIHQIQDPIKTVIQNFHQNRPKIYQKIPRKMERLPAGPFPLPKRRKPKVQNQLKIIQKVNKQGESDVKLIKKKVKKEINQSLSKLQQSTKIVSKKIRMARRKNRGEEEQESIKSKGSVSSQQDQQEQDQNQSSQYQFDQIQSSSQSQSESLDQEDKQEFSQQKSDFDKLRAKFSSKRNSSPDGISDSKILTQNHIKDEERHKLKDKSKDKQKEQKKGTNKNLTKETAKAKVMKLCGNQYEKMLIRLRQGVGGSIKLMKDKLGTEMMTLFELLPANEKQEIKDSRLVTSVKVNIGSLFENPEAD